MADTSKKLTYAGAVGALQAGGSVFWRDGAGVHHLISSLAALPPEHIWVAGDPAGEAAAQATLETQIAALNTQLAALTARMDQAPPKPAPPTHYELLADEGEWKKGTVVPAADLGDQVAPLLKAKKIKAVAPPGAA